MGSGGLCQRRRRLLRRQARINGFPRPAPGWPLTRTSTGLLTFMILSAREDSPVGPQGQLPSPASIAGEGVLPNTGAASVAGHNPALGNP